MYNIVNVLNAAELYTLQWLKWYILCYVYFITVKQNWGLYFVCFCFLPLVFLMERKKHNPSLERQEGTSERLSVAGAVNHEAPPTSLVIGAPGARRGLGEWEFGTVPQAGLYIYLL